MEHQFTLQVKWQGGRNDVGALQATGLNTAVSIPPEMDGPGVGTNPDEMLLGAAATCYIITLAAMLERTNIAHERLLVVSDGFVDVTNGVFTYKKIVHHVRLRLVDIDEKRLRTVERLIVKAEKTCMISKALAGNVHIEVQWMFD